MTATLTSAAQGYSQGARMYCFDLRTSTVAAGVLWLAAAAWIFVADSAGTVVKRHHGLELVHISHEDGQRVVGLVVDEDGTAEFSSELTTTVDTFTGYTCYLSDAANGGSDSNNGTSAGTPKLTVAAANTLIRANWTPGGEHRIIMKGALTSTSPTGGAVWNGTDAAGGGTALSGRLHWVADGTASMTVSGGSAVSFSGAAHGFHNEGVDIIGPYTAGGADPSEIYGISRSIGSAGSGYNVSARNCTIEGFTNSIVCPSSAVAISSMEDGAFDWMAFDNVTFGINYASHVFANKNRYLGFSSCTWGELNGAGTGQGFRCDLLSYASWTDCTQDRTVGSWKANVFRFPGGQNSGTWDKMQFISVHNHTWIGSVECVEFEQAGASEDAYYADIWFHGCVWDSGVVSASVSMFSFGASVAGFSVDLLRVRVTNCAGRCNADAAKFSNISTDSTSLTPKVHSVHYDQNTWYQEQSQGFFTRDSVFLTGTGNAGNYDDDALSFYSNYAFCNDTDANSPRCFWIIPSASAKVGDSNYNVLASAGTNTTTWSDADSLATWNGATGFDANSVLVTSASHNMTNVTALSFNPEPAADGTPSATLPQVRRGMPGLGYADANRYLRDATLPDAGAHEYGTGTLMDDPDFGGGGAAFFYSLSPMDNGFRTIAAAGLNGVLL